VNKDNRYLSTFKIAVALVISVFLNIIMISNYILGLIGGVWLAQQNEWKSLLYGFGLAIAVMLAYKIILLITQLIDKIFSTITDRKSTTYAFSFNLITSIYTFGLIGYWTIWVYNKMLFMAPDYLIYAYLMWGYATVVAPLLFWARRETMDAVTTSIGLIFAQITYLLCCGYYFFGTDFTQWLYYIIGLGVISSILVIGIGISESKQRAMVKKEREMFNINKSRYSYFR